MSVVNSLSCRLLLASWHLMQFDQSKHREVITLLGGAAFLAAPRTDSLRLSEESAEGPI
jgi:hypothetical protein